MEATVYHTTLLLLLRKIKFSAAKEATSHYRSVFLLLEVISRLVRITTY